MSEVAQRTCPSCRKSLPSEAVFCLHCGARTPTEPGVPPRTAPTGAHEVSRLSRAVADRYRIERVIGEGGMATVYLAEDLKHHRKVALKVMRPELAETLGTDRFLREVEIAARLSHPGILAVFDSGQSDGFLYYVMPFVEGESLPERLARERQLPAADALRIAREVAEALAYAHSQGVVHRDIKPANILLSAGHALVADFGIARPTVAQEQALTRTGLAIGTPQYMSPEQASGATDIDGRTDIYSLGCVLYEMLTGEPPFTGPTAQAVIARSLSESPRPLDHTREGLPPAVSSSVLRSLAKSPADRFRGAGEFAAALADAELQTRSGFQPTVAAPIGARLGWKTLAVAAAVILALGAGIARIFGVGGADGGEMRRLAVLPFDNQGNPDDAFFADGIVDEVRGKLARLPRLSVIASTSAGQYRGSTKAPVEIARELGVDYLLVGRVRWLGDTGTVRRVQVVSELVDGRTGATTWQDSFDGRITDVFQMQATMAARVAGALGTALGTADERDLANRPTSSALAYELYLRGKAITDNGAAAQRSAAGYFEQAVALDAGFADAWAALGSSLSSVYANGTRELPVGRRAREAIDRARELAPNSVASYLAASRLAILVDGDFDAAGATIARALAIEPRNPAVLAAAGQLDATRGNADSAVLHLEMARELDPRSTVVLSPLLNALVLKENFERAKEIGHEVIALDPGDLQSVQTLTEAYLGTDDLEGARDMLRSVLQRVPSTQVVTYFAGYNELAWVLEPKEQALLFRLTAAAFDNDVAWWGQALAIAAHQRGDLELARAYADSSLATSAEQSRANPGDAQLRVLYGVMLAYDGQKEQALAEGRLALESAPARGSVNNTYAMLQMARIEIAVGEYDRAIRTLTESRQLNYPSRGRLRLDPTFAPLRGMPGFEALVK
ncbi:MAG TPA: protein kinase [Gemmatimonadales bacterium]|nr:protein kinase [Gemmatimonadales bacterium]